MKLRYALCWSVASSLFLMLYPLAGALAQDASSLSIKDGALVFESRVNGHALVVHPLALDGEPEGTRGRVAGAHCRRGWGYVGPWHLPVLGSTGVDWHP
ncbi:MAG: hypothetical protein ACOX4G_06265 [Limnochordia bacterium]